MPYMHIELLLLCTIYFVNSTSMMMRNDALISKMVSNFQKDNSLPSELMQHVEKKPKNVVAIMQSVLCKNFPTIPCDMIVQDETLKSLIERSIQQLKFKKLSMEKTTLTPAYHLTLFPTINSEDLSNFLKVSETGYYGNDKAKARLRKHKKRLPRNNRDDKETKKKNKRKDSQRTSLYGGPKKMRKFYPHKIKYKDKIGKAQRDNYRDYSEEKLSMSVEAPESSARKRASNNYVEAPDPPVWRIDYTRHGEPGINMFKYEPDLLQEKLVKSVPSVGVSQNLMEQVGRKDVLHPDVYIKKNYIRKNALDMSSGAID